MAGLPVLARIAFVLYRAPVSLNRTYGARAITRVDKATGMGKQSAMIYKNKVAEDQALTLAHLAMAARQKSRDWPTNPAKVAHVRISMYAYNTRSDAASNLKLVADAFENFLYVNDRVVSWGEIPKPGKDGPDPRIEFIIDLLEITP